MDNFTISFNAMGSHIQVWLAVATLDDAQILERVPGWFEEWEGRFSRFREQSELSRLNRCAGQWVKVSSPLLAVISEGVRGAEEPNGLFNPLILPALRAAGYAHSFDASSYKADEPIPFVMVPDFHQIEIDRARSLVRLPLDAEIDLGGIAKGWSAQETANRLAQIGPCLVDAGGDMVAIGSADESCGWDVSVP